MGLGNGRIATDCDRAHMILTRDRIPCGWEQRSSDVAAKCKQRHLTLRADRSAASAPRQASVLTCRRYDDVQRLTCRGGLLLHRMIVVRQRCLALHEQGNSADKHQCKEPEHPHPRRLKFVAPNVSRESGSRGVQMRDARKPACPFHYSRMPAALIEIKGVFPSSRLRRRMRESGLMIDRD